MQALITPLASFSNMIPIPGDTGKITGSLSNQGSTVSLNWQSTGNQNDSYSVWTYSGSIPSGYIPYSACGVENFMTEQTNADIAIQGLVYCSRCN